MLGSSSGDQSKCGLNSTGLKLTLQEYSKWWPPPEWKVLQWAGDKPELYGPEGPGCPQPVDRVHTGHAQVLEIRVARDLEQGGRRVWVFGFIASAYRNLDCLVVVVGGGGRALG